MDSNNPKDEAIREGDPPFLCNDDRDEAIRPDSEKSPADPERQKRARWRIYAAALWAVGTGLMLIFMFDSDLIWGVPAPWVGWFVIGVAVLGVLGVNVFSRSVLRWALIAGLITAIAPTGLYFIWASIWGFGTIFDPPPGTHAAAKEAMRGAFVLGIVFGLPLFVVGAIIGAVIVTVLAKANSRRTKRCT